MANKHYAILFKRNSVDDNSDIKSNLEAFDFIEGHEMVRAGSKRKFVISESDTKRLLKEHPDDKEIFEFFRYKRTVGFANDGLTSNFVYGSPFKEDLFKELLTYNFESMDEALKMIGIETSDKCVEFLKEKYLESMKRYYFFQKKNQNDNSKIYCTRKVPIAYEVDLSEPIEDIVEAEMELSLPAPEEQNEFESIFKPINTKIDMKKIYNECKEYVIGQDEHILPILGGINDNLNATIPEEKSNILVCGSTGVGKSLIFKKIASTIGIPIVMENATQFTKAGYVGRNIDDIFEDLIQAADGDKDLAEKGIIFIDEIDKKASGNDDSVSGVGVLQSMLKLMEGGEYTYEHGHGSFSELRTFNTLNTTIALGGAFSGLAEQTVIKHPIGFDSTEPVKKPIDVYSVENLSNYGVPPEFIGRINLLELLNDLSVKDLKNILLYAKVNPYSIFLHKMERYNTIVTLEDGFLDAVAEEAYKRKTGARGLYSIFKDATKMAEAEIQFMGDEPKELRLTKECVKNNRLYTIEILNKNNTLTLRR